MSDFINTLTFTSITWTCLFSVLITALLLFYCLHKWDKEWEQDE